MSDNELQDALDGKEPDALPDIIYDRSKLDLITRCPHQARLEQENPTETQDPLPVAGTIIHELVEETFEFCQDSQESADMADYFMNELPKARPDLQPEVIQGAKGLIRDLLYINPNSIIAWEKQLEHVILPATPTQGRVVVTQCLDLLMYGFGDELIIWDWKSGYKERDKVTAWNDMQAQCGAWLIWKNYDGEKVDADGVVLPKMDNVKFVFKETRKGRSVEAEYIRDKHPYSLPDVTHEFQIQARINTAIRLHMTGCDEAWPSEKKCLWCNHIRECKHCNTTAREIATDPHGYVKNYNVITARMAEMKKAIVEYLKAGNEIVDPDGLTARKKTPKSIFTLEVVDTNKPAGVKKTRGKKKVAKMDLSQFA